MPVFVINAGGGELDVVCVCVYVIMNPALGTEL